MFIHRKRRDVPELNTTSTADISFMLLILFLVTSSMDTDKGLPRQLPPQEQEQQTEHDIKQRNVLHVALDAHDRLTCEGDTITPGALRQRVEDFIDNRDNDPHRPERHERQIPMLGKCHITDQHIIAIQVDRGTSYNAYFDMQDAIVAAYASLRDRLSRRRFHHPLSQCTQQEREALMMYYPQRLSEADPTQEGGQP